MKKEESDNGKKPEGPQWLIDNIAEASKNSRKIYLLYLGFLAYCALTAISTTDRNLVLNEPAHLPIVNVGVPLEGFFIFAPILAIFTFVYLQLNLLNLNRLKSELREDYPHVKKERIYPWLINVVDNPEPGAMGVIQRIVVSFSLWWSLIIVLILFALYYVKKHDIAMSYILGSLPVIGTFIVFWFRSRYESLRFSEFLWKGKMRLSAGIILVLLEFFFLAFIIPWSIYPIPWQGGKYEFLRPWIYVDLRYQNLVTEPETDYEGLYWADFSGVHLEGANLESAVLKRADIRDADLKRAYLEGANLQEARLVNANLQEAVLPHANLQGASLAWANLQYAYLSDADLQGTVLGLANLQGADFGDANLQGADLGSSNLQGAYFDDANLQEADLLWVDSLTIEQLSEVKTLYEAQLDSVLYEQVKAQYPHLLEPPEEVEEKE